MINISKKNNPYEVVQELLGDEAVVTFVERTNFGSKFFVNYLISVCFSIAIPLVVGLVLGTQRNSMVASMFWTIGLLFPVCCVVPSLFFAALFRYTDRPGSWKWCIISGVVTGSLCNFWTFLLVGLLFF